MKKLLLLFAISLSACGGTSGNKLPICDAKAEASHGLKCTVGVDTECRSSVGNYDCTCTCQGYWECDQVEVICGDAGMPVDSGHD